MMKKLKLWKTRYLRVKFRKDGSGKAKVESRGMQGKKVGGALKALVKGKV